MPFSFCGLSESVLRSGSQQDQRDGDEGNYLKNNSCCISTSLELNLVRTNSSSRSPGKLQRYDLPSVISPAVVVLQPASKAELVAFILSTALPKELRCLPSQGRIGMRFRAAMWCAALHPRQAAGLLALHLTSGSSTGGSSIAKTAPHGRLCSHVLKPVFVNHVLASWAWSEPSRNASCRRRHRRTRALGGEPLFHDDHSHSHAGNDHGHADDGGGDRMGAREGVGSAVVVGVPSGIENCQSHSHGHGHKQYCAHSHFHVDVASLKARPTLARLFVATMCVLALPLWRRSSRLEWAALGGVSLFLAAVDVGKFAVRRLRVQFGQLYSGWKAHSELASISHNKSMDATKEMTVTWMGVFVNIGLAGFKFFAGIVGHSEAMIADAVHSLSDLFSDAVTLWAVRLSRLPPDDDHPYGHGRFESVGAFIIALMLMGAGYGIGNHAFEALREVVIHGMERAMLPTRLTAIAAAVSIITKEALFRVTVSVGRQRNSQVLIANAWHHRTDAVSSVVSLLAIIGSICGAPMLDPLAGLMVAGMVALTGVQVSTDAMAQLTDAADYDVRRRVAEMATQVPGVLSFDRIRARRMGPQTLVDLTIQTEGMISASAAQQVGQRVRWKILEKMPFVADVMVNIAVEPKPCPAMSNFRPQENIEQDIRNILAKELPEVDSVPKIMVHYINMVTTAEVFVQVDPNMRIRDAADIARRAKRVLSSGVHDLCSAEVHLDMVEALKYY